MAQEFLLVDIVRYLVAGLDQKSIAQIESSRVNAQKEQPTPRWLIIGQILILSEAKLIKSLIKQAIFTDWLFYDGGEPTFFMIQTGANIIIQSMSNVRELSIELMEFLIKYSEE